MSRRPFLPLDVAFMDDAKIIEAGPVASWCYLAMLLGCKRFGVDGILTDHQMERLAVDKWRKSVDKLIAVGLVLDGSAIENGRKSFIIPSWSRWNLLSHEREAVSQSKRDAINSRWAKHRECNTSCNTPCTSPEHTKKRREEKRTTKNPELSTFTDSLQSFIQEKTN